MTSEPLPPPTENSAPAGWYPDPSGSVAWRWWDGFAWTAHAAAARHRKPRLPRWLSPPVLVCGVVVAVLVGIIAAQAPAAAAAGLIPLLIVLPVLSWLDRVEPEPRSSKVHAVLWGASVAIVISGSVNIAVGAIGGEVLAMVVSAPLIEEASKGLGILWAVRRQEVDGVSDGVVYAGWVALGFAVVEDMTYFAVADVEGALVTTVIVRALLTPFAHPLFTVWTGLAVGLAVRNGRAVWPRVWWGYALAVLAHAMWNGSLALTDLTYNVDEDTGTTVLLLAMLLFVTLFVAVAVTLAIMRGREQRRFVERVPSLVLRYQIAPYEAAMFTDWRTLLRSRRSVPRSRRRHFDRLHGSLARLSFQHDRPAGPDPVREQVLVAQLDDALRRFRTPEV